MTTHSRDIADELKHVMRLAGRDPEALEHQLPALSALHRVIACGESTEAGRVHFILHRLIPEYLERLPGSRDCRAIRELLTWEDEDGDLQSLTTRYHKAAAHLVYAASDFGRRQEPRLLQACARRFLTFDHEDRLGAPPASPAPWAGPAASGRAAPLPDGAPLAVADPIGGIVRVHPNLDYHLLLDRMGRASEIVLLNTWIPGIDIIADALADALARGTAVSVLMLDPDSEIARLRSRALQEVAQQRFHQERVQPGVRHCLEVLAATARMVAPEHARNLRVGLYRSLPSMCVYGIDETSFVSYFVHGRLAVKSLQIEVCGRDSVLGRLVTDETAALWSIADEIENIAQWPREAPTRQGPRRDLAADRHVTPPAAVAAG
jgi:hypothetical protein